MMLALDIGNSNVVIGLHDGNAWKHVWRIPTITDDDVNFYKLQIANHWVETNLPAEVVRQVMISSVVPLLTNPIIAFCADLFTCPVQLAGPAIYREIELEVLRPHEIGSDLVANAYAASRIFAGKDALIVDFGTALTFVAVGRDKKLHGVSIAPGLRTAIKALNTETAKLPEVPLVFPDTVTGKDTVHAIQSGVLIGYEGLIKHLIARYRAELNEALIVIATGGLVGRVEALHKYFDHILPELTLDGLRLMASHIGQRATDA
ncbi:MAG: type III pantothenate kinase [Saprospiraceae bacterium]|nr:type III pantothenate kinase [Saprospiraceae bacterium]